MNQEPPRNIEYPIFTGEIKDNRAKFEITEHSGHIPVRRHITIYACDGRGRSYTRDVQWITRKEFRPDLERKSPTFFWLEARKILDQIGALKVTIETGRADAKVHGAYDHLSTAIKLLNAQLN